MSQPAIQIAPSILSADMAHLARDLEAVAGADLIHFDVMDGRFVPNITFGPDVLRAVRRSTGVPVDAHLMVADPDVQAAWFADAGASIVTVHWEASTHLNRTIADLHARGVRAGVVLNPATPVSVLEDILDDLDMVLLMSVNPGFGGQSFIPRTLHKVRALRQLIDERGARALIEVDGGVSLENAGELAAAGADVLVAGSAVFKSPDPADAVTRLREAACRGARERTGAVLG